MNMIVFAISEPFTKNCMVYSYVKYFFNKGYSVQVLDLTQLTRSSYRPVKEYEMVMKDVTLRIANFRSLYHYLKNISADTVLINEIAGEPLSSAVANILFCLKHVYICQLFQGAVPFSASRSEAHRYISELKRFRKFSYKILAKLLNRCFDTTPDLVVVGGTESIPLYEHKFGSAHVLRTHSWDFDLYLSDNTPRSKERVVFIDSNYFQSEDEKLAGFDYSILAQPYLKKLNQLFFEIEEHLGWKVVVATHPRVDVEARQLDFPDFEVVKSNTLGLVKGAHCVLMNPSTAVSFVTLSDVPALLLTSDELKQHHGYKMFDNFSRELNMDLKPIESLSVSDIQKLSQSKMEYEKYIAKFIKFPDTPGIPSFIALEKFLLDSGKLKVVQ